MVTQINLLVEHMGDSQLAYQITRMLNNLADTRLDVDAIVYFNTTVPFRLLPKFAMMQMVEAWGQSGINVATSCATMRKMLTFPGAQHHAFYVWDLEWLRGENRHYEMFAPLYQHPNIPLITRSKSHFDAIENCFNITSIKPMYIVEDFNEEQFLEVIEKIQNEKVDRKSGTSRVHQKA